MVFHPAQASSPTQARPFPAPLARRIDRRRAPWLDRACFVFVLALWGIGCLGWSLAAPMLRRLLPPTRREAAGEWGIRRGFCNMLTLMEWTGLARLDLAALDALPDRPMVLACNHPGLLDAVLVISRLRGVVCITKASLWDNWFLGGGIRLAGYIRNDQPMALVRAGVASLSRGRRLLVFPEGTRTAPDATVDGFRAGFALMARAAGVPVQTVLIECDSPYLRKGWPLVRMPKLPIAIRVRVGQQFMVEGDVRLFVTALHRYFERELGAGAGACEAAMAQTCPGGDR